MNLRKIIGWVVVACLITLSAACGKKEAQEEMEGKQEIQEEVQQSEEQAEEAAVETAENVTETEDVSEGAAEENTDENTEETEGEEVTESSEIADSELQDLLNLLGMDDAETAECFGGGEENWTEDGSLYIGRKYQVPLYGESFPAFTSCDEQKIVNAVSVWLANGERTVTEEEVNQWVERITPFTGGEPSYNDTSSEAGSKVWKWFFDGKYISLYWTGDILSISMNPAVGELQ